MEDNSKKDIWKKVQHHQQQQLCQTRPAYRQGRNLTAVKVYTVSSESQHLFIYGVPKINLRTELKSVCSRYGQIRGIRVVTDHQTEIFTECYHVTYERIQSTRIAKRLIDNRAFYGGILHVCYAPEFETLEETKAKLDQRQKDVLSRLPGSRNYLDNNSTGSNNNNKRKSTAQINHSEPSSRQKKLR